MDFQDIDFEVRMCIPIQKDAHTSFIEEQIYVALLERFGDLILGVEDKRDTLLEVRMIDRPSKSYLIPYEEYNERTVLSPETARAFLRRTFCDQVPYVEEYIEEFEHQEGTEGAWAMFHTLNQVAEDFELYVDSATAVKEVLQ